MFFGDHKILSRNLKGGVNNTQAIYRLPPWRKIKLCFENELLSGRGTQLRSVPVLCNQPFYYVNCKPKGNKSEGFFSSIGWTFLIVKNETFYSRINYVFALLVGGIKCFCKTFIHVSGTKEKYINLFIKSFEVFKKSCHTQ